LSPNQGSTCAITESILRAHGYKTGFYSSPHLVSATERIRLDGRPISQQAFAKYFWKVYTALLAKRESDDDMPAYFKFLTLMAFHVFIEEKVDCAIVEVGIGGAFDCTNVLRTTKTVGITSLGLEHTNILGDTLEEIAWQKAGIIKPGSRVFTMAHPEVCSRVIKQQCQDKNVSKSHLLEINRKSKCLHCRQTYL
jgi:folylpolyglutamate synthase